MSATPGKQILAADEADAGPTAPPIEAVRAIVEEHFPGLWPAVDLGLSVCATLLLKDNANPVALIYLGGPSSGKTTVANIIARHPICYVSDKFTTAAFVSQSANVKAKDLSKVDLLPRIKHKVLVTPELAPIFRGKEDELVTRFSIITRVMLIRLTPRHTTGGRWSAPAGRRGPAASERPPSGCGGG